ncbi:MAG: cyclic di-GMP phosphodiesterase, partial [Clostridiales bacterium]|nr:cyclic di-GMP phosphodiesterase [Clostridiales bacterium]
PDLILLDVMMPVMDGYETCKKIKERKEYQDIPIIFLTAKNDAENESRGLDLGAVDYITKPVNPAILLSRVKAHLSLKASRDFLKNKNEYLEKEIARRTKEIALIQEVSIVALASLAETRDQETGNHLERTKEYVRVLCHELAEDVNYKEELTDVAIELITASSPLHDIGKVGIPDAILLKPGKLSKEEYEVMKSHTLPGLQAIERAERMMQRSETFFKYPKQIVYSHHEWWNGAGYPRGFEKEEIPLSARIVAVADVYDALRSKRVYKAAYSHEETMKMIKEESGTHFEPTIVQAFLEKEEEFDRIFLNYKEDI